MKICIKNIEKLPPNKITRFLGEEYSGIWKYDISLFVYGKTNCNYRFVIKGSL